MGIPHPDRVRPAELADRSQVIDFKGKVGDFGRLSSIVLRDLEALGGETPEPGWREQEVSVRLAFRWLDKGSGLPAARGEVSTEVAAVCQRCLEAFSLPVVAPVDAVFVADDNDVLPDDGVGTETWTMDGDMLSLRDVVEESLVMALPLAPAHSSVDDCGPLAGRIPVREPETNRPFADLKSQLQKANE